MFFGGIHLGCRLHYKETKMLVLGFHLWRTAGSTWLPFSLAHAGSCRNVAHPLTVAPFFQGEESDSSGNEQCSDSCSRGGQQTPTSWDEASVAATPPSKERIKVQSVGWLPLEDCAPCWAETVLMHGRLPPAYLESLCLGFIFFFFFQPLSHWDSDVWNNCGSACVRVEKRCHPGDWVLAHLLKFHIQTALFKFHSYLPDLESIIQIQLTGVTFTHGALPCYYYFFPFYFPSHTFPHTFPKKSAAVSKCTKALRCSSCVCSREEELASRFNVSKLKSQKITQKA